MTDKDFSTQLDIKCSILYKCFTFTYCIVYVFEYRKHNLSKTNVGQKDCYILRKQDP